MAMRALLALFLLMSLHARAVLTVTAIPYDDACGNGTGWINAFASGGVGPYTYFWSPVPPNGQGTNAATGLFAGTYTVTVTDSNADQAQATATVNTIASLLPMTLAAYPTTCDGACNGTANALISGPWGGLAPYTATIGPVGSATWNPNGVYLANLCPATTYTVTVTDANGCSDTWNNITTQDFTTPVLLNQTITGSCSGGATGSAVLDYDQVGGVAATTMGGAPAPYLVMGNQVLMNNLPPGQYTVSVFPVGMLGPSGCDNTTLITIPVSPNPCGNVQGTSYVDLNADCVQDVSDVPYPNRLMEVQPGNHHNFTDAAGQYNIELFYGSYGVALTNAADHNALCPPVVPAPFTLSGLGPTATIDFALESVIGPDMYA